MDILEEQTSAMKEEKKNCKQKLYVSCNSDK